MARSYYTKQFESQYIINLYRKQFINLAENVFLIKNLPKSIKSSYVNRKLLRYGEIAFFVDDVLNELIAMPFSVNANKYDNNEEPTEIFIDNNNYIRKLKKEEFVIMRDNTSYCSILPDIFFYAERYAKITKIIDCNIEQQRTPRIFKTSKEQELSLKNLLNNIDADLNAILVYKDLDLTDTEIILNPSPFLADKLEQERDRIWSEFMRLIGITSLTYNKKERLITDEVEKMNGGATASRFNRFSPRLEAVEEINEKFSNYLDKKIDVMYYDNFPTSQEEKKEEKKGETNVL